eukprot:Hpha_TRINITY_DN259_c0_g1::TRINITY_DN259_c0_g1_i1::g.83585::m.83585
MGCGSSTTQGPNPLFKSIQSPGEEGPADADRQEPPLVPWPPARGLRVPAPPPGVRPLITPLVTFASPVPPQGSVVSPLHTALALTTPALSQRSGVFAGVAEAATLDDTTVTDTERRPSVGILPLGSAHTLVTKPSTDTLGSVGGDSVKRVSLLEWGHRPVVDLRELGWGLVLKKDTVDANPCPPTPVVECEDGEEEVQEQQPSIANIQTPLRDDSSDRTSPMKARTLRHSFCGTVSEKLNDTCRVSLRSTGSSTRRTSSDLPSRRGSHRKSPEKTTTMSEVSSLDARQRTWLTGMPSTGRSERARVHTPMTPTHPWGAFGFPSRTGTGPSGCCSPQSPDLTVCTDATAMTLGCQEPSESPTSLAISADKAGTPVDTPSGLDSKSPDKKPSLPPARRGSRDMTDSPRAPSFPRPGREPGALPNMTVSKLSNPTQLITNKPAADHSHDAASLP